MNSALQTRTGATELAAAPQVPPRILVVEDDEDLSNAVLRIARSLRSDIVVDWACSAEAARQFMRTRNYQLLLADYFLEAGERGSTLIRESYRDNSATALAMMSSLPLAEFVRIAEVELPVGVQILPKPFSALELRGFLHELLMVETATGCVRSASSISPGQASSSRS